MEHVVKQPDHHCGDDLVILPVRHNTSLICVLGFETHKKWRHSVYESTAIIASAEYASSQGRLQSYSALVSFVMS